MFVYIKSESELWTVGHYPPGGKFVPESDHRNETAAAERTAWLNGSRPPAAGALVEHMTIRDYFAAAAMQAMINDWWRTDADNQGTTYDDLAPGIADDAYIVADAMLKKRKG